MITLLEYLVMAGTAGGLVAVALWPIFVLFLNPRFDSDWKRRRWAAFESESLPFFALFRMALYVPAVASRFCAIRLFGVEEAERYDFRRRAGPVLYALCLMEVILGGLGISLTLFAGYTLRFMH